MRHYEQLSKRVYQNNYCGADARNIANERNGCAHNYLSNYLQTYLEKDIRALSTINDLNLYLKLIEIIAEQTGSVRQDKEIIEALGCSRDNFKKISRVFIATLAYKEIYPLLNDL